MKAYLLLLLVLIFSSLLAPRGMADSVPVACPMFAKLCPDGSSVSPQGPNCEVPACPAAKKSTAEPSEADDCDDDDCDHKKTDEPND